MNDALPRSVTFAVIGEAGLLVFFPNRISPEINARVHTLRSALVQAAEPAIVDIVPAYASLLVTFDPDRTTHDDLRERIRAILAAQPGEAGVRPGKSISHLVPVQYGEDAGPDLAETARLNNLTNEGLIRLHSGRSYRAYFLGFLPGFAYLGKLPATLTAPRLATPRSRVPAGSVGIAGAQTATYPSSSPGGWRILGRTSLRVWDPFSNEPARIAPGDTVRFVPSDSEPRMDTVEPPAHVPQRPVFELLAAPGLTTLQDLGRPGFAHVGVATGGAFDPVAAIRANALAGNGAEAAVLEMTWIGPTLRVLSNVTIALEGADLHGRAGGAAIPAGMSWFVRRGSVITFSGANSGSAGVRCYLAVTGGFDAPKVMSSRSTSLQGGFGGIRGRPLRAGDVLGIAEPGDVSGLLAGQYWPIQSPDRVGSEIELRFTGYTGRSKALSTARSALASKAFRLTEQADRMGCRFAATDGARLPTRTGELLSFGVVRAAIQLPPDGNPLVLNVDHQTTGGYPLLGAVIRADWPLLAQLAPGAVVRFKEVSLEEANVARRQAEQELERGLRRMRAGDLL